MPAPEIIADRYEVLRPLGRGGMGDVLLVRDRRDGSEVALKRLHLDDEEAARRFREEFAILARIDHPNIVRVHDFGALQDGSTGAAFFTMEHLAGSPIDEAIAPGDVRSVFNAFLDVSSGLDALYAAGIVHCDLKPSNIHIVHDEKGKGSARLLDFGLAGRAFSGERQLDAGSDAASRPETSGLTRVRGTPGYVPLEVVDGGPYTPATDAFALGATLYRVLTGRPAFPGRNSYEILRAQRSGQPSFLPLRNVGVPRDLEAALMGLLHLDPERRVESLGALRDLANRHASSGADLDTQWIGSRGRLVGRYHEKELLTEHLLRKGARLAVIRGPKGSGRTRLARELAVEAEFMGWDVHWLEPEATFSLPHLKYRVLIVVDDIQDWSRDKLTSLQLPRLDFLAIIITVDEGTDEVDWSGPLLTHDLDFQRRDLTLGGLTGEAVDSLVHSRLGPGAPDELAPLLAQHVGALPDDLHRAIDQLIARRLVREEGGRWSVDDVAEDYLRSGLKDEVETALTNMSLELRVKFLRLACDLPSSLPREATEGLESLVTDGDGPRLRSRVVADAIRSHLLPRANSGELAPLLSELDAQGEPSPRRLRLRGDVQMASGLIEAATQSFCMAVLSSHDVRDSDVKAALGQLHHSGRHILDNANLIFDVIDWLAARGGDKFIVQVTGIALALDVGATAAVRSRFAYERGRALHRLGDFENALAVLDSHPRDPGQSDPPASEWSAQRALSLQYLGRLDEAEVEYETALRELANADRTTRARTLNRYAMFLFLHRDEAQGRSLLGEAQLSAKASGDALVLGAIMSNLALVSLKQGDPARAQSDFAESANLFERAGRVDLLGTALVNCASAASAAGDWSGLDEYAERAEALARRNGNPMLLLNILATRMTAALRRGHFDAAMRIQRTERTWLPSVKRREARLHHLVTRAELLRHRGKDEKSVRILHLLLKELEHEPSPRYEALTRLGLGAIAARRGRSAAAERQFQRAIALQSGDAILVRQARIAMSRLSALRQSEAISSAVNVLIQEHSAALHEGYREEAAAWRDLIEGRSDSSSRGLERATLAYSRDGLLTERLLANHDAGLAFSRRGYAKDARKFLRAAYVDAQSTGADSASIAEAIVEIDRIAPPLADQDTNAEPERETLYRVSEVLNSAFDPSSLLPRALALVCERIGAERGFILLSHEFSDPRPVAQYGTVDDESRASALEVSRTVIRKVTTTGEPFRTDDAASDPRLGSTLSVLDMSVRSLLCVPLRQGDDVVGTIYAENRSSAGQFDETQVELVEAFANVVAVAMQNARLHEELRRSRDRVVSENLSLRREVTGRYKAQNLIGQSDAMERVLGEIERVAQSRVSVLITGESGTGKELVAKTIHFSSPRASRPFLSLNCAALSADLIESELFGIEARVATGVDRRLGVFERADGGTLFLDEIGDMPLDLQAKLLRVLQEREITRIGGSELIKVDIRLIAATNQDLRQLIQDRKFREDLYFRIHTLPIELPPLRERRVDIPLLAQHFLIRFCEENGLPQPRMSVRFTEHLLRHDWPGNVRELQNFMERSIVMSRDSVLEPERETEAIRTPAKTARGHLAPSSPQDFKSASREAERGWIVKALEESGGNQRRAAALLGIPEPTLRYRMARLGIEKRRMTSGNRARSQKPAR